MYNFTALPPLGLYIHMPWCVRKCPYCDFNSHTAASPLPEKAYIDALIRDLEQEVPAVWGRPVRSIFIGGGTPSLFSAKAYAHLLSAVRALVPLSPHAEITLEANPGTVDSQRFADYRELGINRLSVGVQSFHNPSLHALGRIHTAEQAMTAIETAQACGFENINLDLMFGLPGQTREQATRDILTAIDLRPHHISYYQLTLEPNTQFYHSPPDLPDEDEIDDWQQENQYRLAQAGFAQYEVSAYAQKHAQCQHNLNYWQFGDYLGIGAGAHGKISDAGRQTVIRRAKHRHPHTYIETAGTEDVVQSSQAVRPHEIGFEFMLNALRLKHGFPTALFSQHTGLPISQIKHPLEQAEKEGWLQWDIHRIRPTEKGERYLNSLIELFLPE